MAEKKIIFLRWLVIILILVAVGVGLFLIFSAKNTSVVLYQNYQKMIQTTDYQTMVTNIGNLENGNYYDYATTLPNGNFKENYLAHSMAQEIIKNNVTLLAYLDNNFIPNGRLMSSALYNYQNQLPITVEAQRIFNYNYNLNKNSTVPSVREALKIDFENFNNSFCLQVKYLTQFSNGLMDAILNSYFKNFNIAQNSLKYLHSYCVSQQTNLLLSKLTDTAISSALYSQSKSIYITYKTIAVDHFHQQSTNTLARNFLANFELANANLYLLEIDKASYLLEMPNGDNKNKLTYINSYLGL